MTVEQTNLRRQQTIKPLMLRHIIEYLVAVNSKWFQRKGALIDLYCLVGNYYYGFSAKANGGHGDGQHRRNG